MPCDWYNAVVLVMRSNSIPDKFAQRDVSRFGLLGRTLLTVKRNQSETILYIAAVWCAALVGSVPPHPFETGGYKFQPAKAICMYAFNTTLLTQSLLNAFILQRLYHSSHSATSKCFTRSHSQIKFSRKKITLSSSKQTWKKRKWQTVAAVMAGFTFKSVSWITLMPQEGDPLCRDRPTLHTGSWLIWAVPLTPSYMVLWIGTSDENTELFWRECFVCNPIRAQKLPQKFLEARVEEPGRWEHQAFEGKTGSITLVKETFVPLDGRIYLENKESNKRLRWLVMLWCCSSL